MLGFLVLVGSAQPQASTRRSPLPIGVAEDGPVEIVDLTPNRRKVTIEGEQSTLLRSVLRSPPIEVRPRDPVNETDEELEYRHSWGDLLVDGHRIKMHGHRWIYRDSHNVYYWADTNTYAVADILISEHSAALEGRALRAFVEQELQRVAEWKPPSRATDDAPGAGLFAPTGEIIVRSYGGPELRLEGDVAVALRGELNSAHSTWKLNEGKGEGDAFRVVPNAILVIDGHELRLYGHGLSGPANGFGHSWVTPVTYALFEALRGQFQAPTLDAPTHRPASETVVAGRVREYVLEAVSLKRVAPPPPADDAEPAGRGGGRQK